VNKEYLGTLLAILTAVVSGISIPLNKIFVVDLDPLIFTAVRGLIIGLVFLVLTIIQKNRLKKPMKQVSWKYLLAIAIVGGSLAFAMFFSGLQLTTSGRGAFLHKTLPLFATLFAFIFLKEKIPKKQLYALLAMFAGLVIMTVSRIEPGLLWSNPQIGDFLIIGATILWALENTIARKAMIEGEHNFIVAFSRMFIGGLILFGIVGVFGRFDALIALTSSQWTNILVSSGILFCYVFFWYWSIRLINVSKASMLLLLAPVISLIVGMSWLNEPLPVLQLAGSALILIGAYFVIGIKSRLSTGV